MAPADMFVFRHDPYFLACLDSGSLMMLSMATKKGRRIIRKMLMSQTLQGRDILRERQLRRMFALDAGPGTLKNNGRALSPFSSDAERARSHGLHSIIHLISHLLPVVSPKTVTLAVSILDRFLLKACKQDSTSNPRANIDGLEASTPLMSRQARDENENTYSLDSPALRRAIPLACVILACKHVETWSPRLADVAKLAPASNARGPCMSKDVNAAELRVIFTLDWNIDPLLAIDVAQELFAVAPMKGNAMQCAELRRLHDKELHRNLVTAAFCKHLCRKPPVEVATACLLDACHRTGICTDFVPLFLRNEKIYSIQQAMCALRPHVDPMLLKWIYE